MTRRRIALCFGAAWAAIPAARPQDFNDIKFERTAKDCVFTQGPAWSPKENFLVFSDLPKDRLMKWAPGHDAEVYREDAHGPSGNAFDSAGRLYTCETRSRRVTRTDLKGAVEVLAEKWDGKRLNAPSGIVVSKNDHIYFTDPAFGSQQDSRDLDFYGVYHLPPKGPLKLVTKWTTRPNGIALSPNGKVLYVAAADEHSVKAYELDKDGEAPHERVFAAKIAGVPSGLHVDEKGNVYVAADRIVTFSPDGEQIGLFGVKERATNVTFGMPDGKMLFVTAMGMVYRAPWSVKGLY
jgi:gluconolactonase